MDQNPAEWMKPKPMGTPQTGGMGNPLAAQPSFNQRKANAQSLYGSPGAPGWANFGFATQQGGGQDAPRPAPPAAADISRPMGPPPVRPNFMQEGRLPGGAPAGPAGALGPPQQADQFGAIRQLFSQPGFMQLLMQYMQQGQRPAPGPSPSDLPPQGMNPIGRPPVY